jgi:type II secretory pathway pseudopilin PulG
MSRTERRAASREAGFTLVALMASVTIMLILMGVGARSWSYVMKDAREEELIFRGGQIADAIQRYQQKNGNTPPASLDVLVKGKFLRKLYKDPMTPKGEWRLVRQGESLTPVPQPSPGPSRGPTPPTTRPSGPGVPVPMGIGPIVGVASVSKEKGLRLFNGRRPYNEWIFAAGQPRVVGRMSVVPPLPGAGVPAPGGGRPGSPAAPR